LQAKSGTIALRARTHAVVYELDEVVPVTVGLDAPQLHDGLNAFLDPTHPAVVATLADDVLDRTFHGATSQLEILLDDLVVGHLVDAFLQVPDHAEQALAFALVAWACRGDGVTALA
jgi:hypothetical protein